MVERHRFLPDERLNVGRVGRRPRKELRTSVGVERRRVDGTAREFQTRHQGLHVLLVLEVPSVNARPDSRVWDGQQYLASATWLLVYA